MSSTEPKIWLFRGFCGVRVGESLAIGRSLKRVNALIWALVGESLVLTLIAIGAYIYHDKMGLYIR